MNSHDALRAYSADAVQDACNLQGQLSSVDSPSLKGIYLQRGTEAQWCAAGGRWVKERSRAARFVSNMDAIAYCVAVSVAGHIVGYDALGRELYRLETDHIVKAFAQPHIARSGSPEKLQSD